VAPDGRKTKVSQHTGGPNGATIGSDGKVYICTNGGFNWHEVPKYGLRPTGGHIERVDLATGKTETLDTECDGFRMKGRANAKRPITCQWSSSRRERS
jgi:gluconolactonase